MRSFTDEVDVFEVSSLERADFEAFDAVADVDNDGWT